jgi:superfamily I DNA/RNA helicase
MYTDGYGTVEDRRGTMSVFNGPAPEIVHLQGEASEERFVADWLNARRQEGVHSEEMAIFVRSIAQLNRGESAARAANICFSRLAEEINVSLAPTRHGSCTRGILIVA